MNMRLRRLENDYLEVAEFLREHPVVGLLKTEGDPPEKYHFEYRLRGVEKKGSEVVPKNRHVAEVFLTLDYPTQEPICRMLTPVFHPNIDPHLICITDRWAAGESLTDVVVRIGRMLCYQTYNIKSPRNGEAAQWAAENLSRFPLDDADLAREKPTASPGKPPAEERKSASPAPAAAAKIPPAAKDSSATPGAEKQKPGRGEQSAAAVPCDNCRTLTPASDIRECRTGHRVCPDCATACRVCGAVMCVLCDLNRCSVCQGVMCPDCQAFCHFHRQTVCRDHIVACAECGVTGCDRCLSLCPGCGKRYCPSHFDKTLNLCAACRKKDIPPVPSCPYCGKVITRKAAKFCPACGQKL